MKSRSFVPILSFWLASFSAFGQEKSNEVNEMKLNLNKDGSHYVKGSFLSQVWLRNTQFNTGSTINGFEKTSYTDLSIRRLRLQAWGQLTDKVFFYVQFGQNNFNFHSPKYTGAFFHDATVEFNFSKKLSLGGGLTGWNGLTRHAAPSIGSILTLDAPLYMQATHSLSDQFLRKLSIYAKGQLGKIDYRLALTSPMTLSGTSATAITPTSTSYSFSNEPPKMQVQGYVKYMFMDSESNTLPYAVGSYLGTKHVFNIGAGFIYQPDAMWALDANGVTIHHRALALYGVDVFYDKPLSDQTAITAYGAFTNYDFGAGYVRHVGVNNPANGLSSPNPSGHGNAFPAIGTGNSFYGQVGYLFGKNVLTEGGKLQPFAAGQFSAYDALKDHMSMYELGMNYHVHGTHGSKLSVVYQSRPTYINNGTDTELDSRKGMAILMYQITF